MIFHGPCSYNVYLSASEHLKCDNWYPPAIFLREVRNDLIYHNDICSDLISRWRHL